MSENNGNDPLKAFGFGYGIDMQYDINLDGTVDILIDETGDIRLVGGTITDVFEQRRKNAIQQIVLRILTPFGSLLDEEGNPVGFGSDLHSLIGQKDTDLNKLAIRAYILSCLSDYEFIESVVGIDVDFSTSGVASITLKIKLLGDDQLIEETIELGA